MASIDALKQKGQSIWLDNIDRRLLVGDGLQQITRLGACGVTNNPTLFKEALEASCSARPDRAYSTGAVGGAR